MTSNSKFNDGYHKRQTKKNGEKPLALPIFYCAGQDGQALFLLLEISWVPQPRFI
jgi:hypothetical protein